LVDEARPCFETAAALRPDRPLWQLRSALACPPVFDSTAEIEAWRVRLEAALEESGEWQGRSGEGQVAAWEQLIEAGCIPPFGLAHQGGSNRALKAKLAGVYTSWFPGMEPCAVRGSPDNCCIHLDLA
jgi:hypothetical protein